MSMNQTPSSNRLHIGIFGKTNAGKSSLINALTGQELAIVSEVAGTTTDPVKKTMELLPLGPVVMIDTAGLDDHGELGKQRIEKTLEILEQIDIGILVTVAGEGLTKEEEEILESFSKRGISHLKVYNKAEHVTEEEKGKCDKRTVYVSAATGEGIFELKEKIGLLRPKDEVQYPLIADLVHTNDVVVLVIPVDESAPKGRLILPQQQTIRELLDAGAIPVVCKDSELVETLDKLKESPKLVVTDSQAFAYVSKVVPLDVKLTSFSILFGRHKGSLRQAVESLEVLSQLEDGDKILIAEGCTHHRQCNDIGTVKLPKWLNEFTQKEFQYEFNSGNTFEKDLSEYKLIIHCGGCMITPKMMRYRQEQERIQKIPMTNYGIIIAKMKGILERSIEILESNY